MYPYGKVTITRFQSTDLMDVPSTFDDQVHIHLMILTVLMQGILAATNIVQVHPQFTGSHWIHYSSRVLYVPSVRIDIYVCTCRPCTHHS